MAERAFARAVAARIDQYASRIRGGVERAPKRAQIVTCGAVRLLESTAPHQTGATDCRQRPAGDASRSGTELDVHPPRASRPTGARRGDPSVNTRAKAFLCSVLVA